MNFGHRCQLAEVDKQTTSYFRSEPAILLNSSHLQMQMEDAIRVRLENCRNWEFESVHSYIWTNMRKFTYKYIRLACQEESDLEYKKTKIITAFCTVSSLSHTINTSMPNELVLYRRHLNELNLDGLNFPMTVEQIPLFELNNSEYVINVIYPNSEDKTFLHTEIENMLLICCFWAIWISAITASYAIFRNCWQ